MRISETASRLEIRTGGDEKGVIKRPGVSFLACTEAGEDIHLAYRAIEGSVRIFDAFEFREGERVEFGLSFSCGYLCLECGELLVGLVDLDLDFFEHFGQRFIWNSRRGHGDNVSATVYRVTSRFFGASKQCSF